MDATSKLIYRDKGILPPDIVRTLAFFVFPIVFVGTIFLVVAALWIRDWLLFIGAMIFLCFGLIAVFGLNSVEIWVSAGNLIQKENPFNFFPHKPIQLNSIENIEIIPVRQNYSTHYRITFFLKNDERILFTFTKSQEQALEINKIIQDNIPGSKEMERGHELLGKGQYSQAISEFNRAIAANPDNFEAYVFRGKAKWCNQDLQGALVDYNCAIELDDNASMVYMDRSFLFDELGMPELALLDLEKHGKLLPKVQAHPNFITYRQKLWKKTGRL